MKCDVIYSCGHTGMVRLYGSNRDRERKLKWYNEYALCPNCYRAKCVEEKKAMGLVASIRFPALAALTQADHSPMLVIVFDGDTYPHKDELKRLGAEYTDDYPAENAFADLLYLKDPPKRWVMRLTPDQLLQALADLDAIGCQITERPSETDLLVYVNTCRYAQEKNDPTEPAEPATEPQPSEKK